MSIKKGIDKAVASMNDELTRLAIQISKPEEIVQIATISANNDPEIGAIIAQAMQKVGKDGIITIAAAKSIDTTLDVVEGMQIDKGYLSPYFITNPEKMTAELENAYVLIVDKKISSAKDLVPILEKLMEKGQKPLLIIAEDVEGEALATLVVNKIKAGLSVCAIKAPGFGDRRKAALQDIAVLTGATVVTEEIGLQLDEVGLEVLGKAKKIKVGKDETILIDGEGSAQKLKAQVAQIRAEIANSTSDYEREKLEERLAKLLGGVAVIYVGATTETEPEREESSRRRCPPCDKGSCYRWYRSRRRGRFTQGCKMP